VTVIRPETSADRGAVAALNILAFGSDDEARLIDHLRSDGAVIASLVAEEDGKIIGHILFSELPIETEHRLIRGAALAPMTVAPAHQCRRIGSWLVRSGLEACRDQEVEVVVVLGHPEHYPRFGFSAELARHPRSPFSGPAFMALELNTGALEGVEGVARYADGFGLSNQ
jgi:putative acetyltransferase